MNEDKNAKPVMFNCHGCKKVIILQPTYSEQIDNYVFECYCEECTKSNPELGLLVEVTPLTYRINQALDYNVKVNHMTKRWNSESKEWLYSMTETGKRFVEEKILPTLSEDEKASYKKAASRFQKQNDTKKND